MIEKLARTLTCMKSLIKSIFVCIAREMRCWKIKPYVQNCKSSVIIKRIDNDQKYNHSCKFKLVH